MNAVRRSAIFLFLFTTVLSLFFNASWDIWAQSLIHTLTLVILSLLLIQALRNKREITFSYTKADIWFLAYLAGLSLSYLYSVNQFNTRNELYNHFNYYLFFCLCPLLLTDSHWRDLLIRSTVIAAGFISLVIILEFWTGAYITGGPLLNANIASGLFVLILPVLISRLVLGLKQGKSKAWYLAEFLLAIMIIASLLITRSLGAWISLYCSLFLFLVLSWKIDKADSHNHIIRKCIVTGLAIGAIVIGYFIMDKLKEPEIYNRLLWWQGAVNMIKSHPLGGVGLGNFGGMYLVYKTTGLNSVYAHNYYLQLWSEVGIFSLVFWLCGVYTVIRGNLSKLKGQEPQNQYTSVGLICATSGLLIYSLIDYSMYIPAIAIIWWVLLGLMRSSLPVRIRILKINVYHLIVYILIIILLGVLAVTPFFASQRYVTGINYLGQKDLVKARKAFKISLALDPLNSQAYGFLSDIAKEEGNLNEAVDYLRKAISLNRYFGPFHHNLALLYEVQGQQSQAIAEAERALICHRQKPLYHYTLSLLYKKYGQIAKAEQEYGIYQELLQNAQGN